MTSMEDDLHEEQEAPAAILTGINFNVSTDAENVSILQDCLIYLFMLELIIHE